MQPSGIICANEAYSKQVILTRLGISQKFWDKMLEDGLPFTPVGHARWVTGADLILHLKNHSTKKNDQAQ